MQWPSSRFLRSAARKNVSSIGAGMVFVEEEDDHGPNGAGKEGKGKPGQMQRKAGPPPAAKDDNYNYEDKRKSRFLRCAAE